MKKNYINIDDKNYRVEINWNAIADFSEMTGITNLAEFDNLQTLTPRQILTLLVACVREGERQDGRVLEMDEKTFGGIMRPQHIGQFAAIYQSQVAVNIPSDEEKVEKKKKRKIFR